jgi:hypothetical protein
VTADGPVDLGDGISVDYDADLFIFLPRPDEEPDVAGWSRWAAHLWCESEGLDIPQEVEDSLADTLHLFATGDAGQPFNLRFAYIPDLVRGAMPVMMAVGDAPGGVEENLRYFTGADDPTAVEPPILDRMELPTGDIALRTLKYLPGNDGLVVALNYAWWASAGDAYVWVRTASPRPSDVIAAVEDIDAFVRTVVVVAAPDE